MQELLTREAIEQRVKELIASRDSIDSQCFRANLNGDSKRLETLKNKLANLDAELDHLLYVLNVLKEMDSLPKGYALPSVQRKIRALHHAELVLLNAATPLSGTKERIR